jgi:anti-anti-sigma factor
VSERFSIAEVTDHDRQVLSPRGELDLAEVEVLRSRLRALLCAERETVLDLSGLEFIDSSGIQLLFEASREAKSNGWNLQLRDPSPVAYDTLRLAGVLTLLGLDS